MANEFRYFLNSNLFVLIYSNKDGNAKIYEANSYSLPKAIVKNHNVIINKKTFFDQPIGSNIDQYEEIKKLTTGQGENYSTGCL